MENAELKKASSLIKNSEELSSSSRAELSSSRAAEIRAVNGWIKTPRHIITDARLSLADRIIWLTVALIEFHFGRCEESQDVIAAVATVSSRQVAKSTAQLLAVGLMTRERAPLRSLPDRLSVGIGFPDKASAIRGNGPCERCHVDRPVNRLGICVVCRKSEEAEREVREFIARHGPAPLEIVWLGLKGNGSRSSQGAIQRAYLKSNGNPPTKQGCD